MDPNNSQEWVAVGQFISGTEAEVVEACLSTFEIPFIRQYDREGSFTHIFLGNGCIPVEIMVPADRYEESVELLKNHEADSEAEPELEPDGEDME